MTLPEALNVAVNKANSNYGLFRNMILRREVVQEIPFCLTPFELGCVQLRVGNAKLS